MKYTINVTQEDINSGIRQQCLHCPVAIAAKRIFPNKCISVVPAHIRVGKNEFDNGILYKLPDDVAQWITDFDWKHNFNPEPFSFEISDDNLWS